MKNVIFVEWVSDGWKFQEGIEEVTGIVQDVIHLPNFFGKRLKTLIRFGKYFNYAFYIFLRRHRYERIITLQQYHGLIFAFLCRLFRVKKNSTLIIMTFIYKKK